MDQDKTAANRQAAQKGQHGSKAKGTMVDEKPDASTIQGRKGAGAKEVPETEQLSKESI